MKRAKIDWDALESHYRAGIRSLKDMGEQFGVSDAAIVKHARKHGWTRNLAAKVKARADAKVSDALVSAEVSAATKVNEATRVEVEAEVQARIRLGHRKDIGAARSLAMSLLTELQVQTGSVPELEKLGEMLGEDFVPDKALAMFNAVVSLPGRVKTMKDLGDTLHKLIGLERDAYNIGSGGDAPPGSGQVVAVDAQQVATALAKLRSEF
ncbi:hypothetical protein [Luteibacter sp.]|jgi:hypothetical protein|uniref:hypothetical protein n=1 Tax=Luteibacter sp. TaxID=1886636 RepID=UPI002F429E6F